MSLNHFLLSGQWDLDIKRRLSLIRFLLHAPANDKSNSPNLWNGSDRVTFSLQPPLERAIERRHSNHPTTLIFILFTLSESPLLQLVLYIYTSCPARTPQKSITWLISFLTSQLCVDKAYMNRTIINKQTIYWTKSYDLDIISPAHQEQVDIYLSKKSLQLWRNWRERRAGLKHKPW
jgi:hypothetical protein